MYFDEFIQKLSASEIPPIVLLAGDAEDVIAESMRRVREAYRRRHPEGSVSVLDGGDDDLSLLLAGARSASLFSSGQMLVMRRAEKRVGGRSSDAAVELLTEYLMDPDPGTHVVLAAKGVRKDSRVAKLAAKSGWMVQCAELAPWKAVSWIQGRAADAGLRMDPESAQRLLQKVGSDMGLLGTALDQWALVIRPRVETRPQDLDELPVPGGGAGVFEFLDLVTAKRTKEALTWLGGSKPGDPQGMEEGALSLLYGRIRELLAMAALREDGIGEDEAASRLKMHPFRVKNLWAQAHRFKTAELEKALMEIARLQAGQMTGRLSKSTLLRSLERWLLRWGKSSAA